MVTARQTRWVMGRAPDEAAVAALAEALLIPLPLCRLLLSRGHVDPESAKLFLRPRLERLHDPHSMLTLDRAVERLVKAVKNGETIFVHGDYDVDGICSTTLLVRAIQGLGKGDTVHSTTRGGWIRPHRCGSERGGRPPKRKVVVTCDWNERRRSHRETCKLGIDVVTDHHLPGGALPDCVAVLNPQRPGCGYPDKDLAAVGVAFKLALALAKALEKPDGFIWAMLDLVALATVADVAPLRGENRVFVRYGLKMH